MRAILKLKQSVQRLAFMFEFQGVNPKDIAPEVLVEMVRIPDCNDSIEVAVRNRIRSPQTGIRAFCTLCQGGSLVSVKQCEKTNCPLWPFRMGKNPLRGQIVDGKVVGEEEDADDFSDLEAQEAAKEQADGQQSGDIIG